MSKYYLPTIAGVINIISGILILFGFVLIFLTSLAVSTSLIEVHEPEITPEIASGILFGLSSLLLIVGCISVYGGICSLQRRAWGWALVGSIGSFLVEMPLGIGSIVLIVLSRGEFKTKYEEAKD